MKFCTKCGKQLLDEAIMCPGCGCLVNRVETPVKAVEIPMQADEAPAYKMCPHCGAQLHANAQICFNCKKQPFEEESEQEQAPQPFETQPTAPPAYKRCPNCGAQLRADAQFCMKCDTSFEAKVSKRKKSKKRWVILGIVVLLLLGTVAAVLFVPRNLEMDDFEPTGTFGAILKYGYPDNIGEGDYGTYLTYEDTYFYGIPAHATVHVEADTIGLIFRGKLDKFEVREILDEHCRLVNSWGETMTEYRYENLSILLLSSGHNVIIEMN